MLAWRKAETELNVTRLMPTEKLCYCMSRQKNDSLSQGSPQRVELQRDGEDFLRMRTRDCRFGGSSELHIVKSQPLSPLTTQECIQLAQSK